MTPLRRHPKNHGVQTDVRAIGFGHLRVAVAALLLLSTTCQAPPVPSSSAAAPTPTSPPAQTPSPIAVAPEPTLVYFARSELPPVLASTIGHAGGPSGIEARISSRVSALWEATQVPASATNPLGRAGRSGSTGAFSMSVRVDADLATLSFDVGSWGVTSEADARAVVQQVVYTATEEAGIRRVLLAQQGKPSLVMAGVSFDRPLSRDDVAGYSFLGTKTPAIIGYGTPMPSDVVDWSIVNEQVAGLGRFVLELRAHEPSVTRFDPRFTVSLGPCDACRGEEGKWWLTLDLPDTARPGQAIALATPSSSGPIRNVTGPPVVDASTNLGRHAVFVLRVEDARPWRASLELTGPNTARIVIDVGGRPGTLNESIAVYVPVAAQGIGDRGSGCAACRLLGAARVFEANVRWRVRDASGREVGHGWTTASYGTSPTWGTFETQFTVPPNLSGTPTLEVFWESPKDGTDQGLVAIPLTLH